MERAQDETNPDALLNKLEITYNGITLHTDDQNSIKIIQKDDQVAKNLRLLSFEESDLQYTFNFTDDVSIIVMLAQDDADSPLSIFADIPKDITDLFIPFSFAYNLNILKEETNRIVLEGKKQNWSINAAEIAENYLHFTYSDNIAHYAIYDDTKKFTLDSLTTLASAEKSVYNNTVSTITANLISSFKSSLNDNSFTEQSVVAYIAAMAQNGSYKKAIDDIPQDYKKNESRTYLSAPFLDNLSSMNTKLDSAVKESEKTIRTAASSGLLDIFTINNLASRLCIYPEKSDAVAVLKNAVNSDLSKATVAQVSGILRTYVELKSLNNEFALILEPVMESCVQRITDACTFDNDVLTISENDTFLSVVQASEAGISLMRYGLATSNETYAKAGRVIVNSYLGESSSFDLRTLTTLYPLLAYDNYFYPHIKIIRGSGKDAMWAWTCAKEIKYAKDDDGALVLTITFPLEYTHYVIFKSIPSFEQIFIYDMAFRTDPRFETYNSSGYIYKSESKTLLLKSRHKSEKEDIRMSYTPVPKAEPAPKPAETKPEETETVVVPEPVEGPQTTDTTDSPSTGSGTADTITQ